MSLRTHLLTLFVITFTLFQGCSDFFSENLDNETPAVNTENSEAPIQILKGEVDEAQLRSFFDDQLHSKLSTCYSCHSIDGVASNTPLILESITDENAARNYQSVKAYIVDNGSLFIKKNDGSFSHNNRIVFSKEANAQFSSFVSSVAILALKEPHDSNETKLPALFTNSIYPEITANCINCHKSSGIATKSALIFIQGSDKELINYDVLDEYVVQNAQRLLDKVLGVGHGGGNQFGTDKSIKYRDLNELITIMRADDEKEEDNTTTPDNNETLITNHLPALFNDHVYPDMKVCIACHVLDGIADSSALIFASGEEKAVHNYAVLETYAENKAQTLLDKVINKNGNHIGVNLYLDEYSDKYRNLKELLVLMVDYKEQGDEENTTDPEDNTTIPTEDTSALPTLFVNSVYQDISSNCINCHAANLLAKDSNLIFTTGERKMVENYGIFHTYAQNNAQILLDKVLGKSHGGGNQYGSVDSVKYVDLKALLVQIANYKDPIDVNTTDPEDLSGVPAAFISDVYPEITTTCIKCHSAGEQSGTSQLIFTVGEKKTKENYSIFHGFVVDNAQMMLDKVLGQDHIGGNLYGSNSSAKYLALKNLLIDTVGYQEPIDDNNTKPQNDNTTGIPELFIDSVYPTFQSDCINCHAAGLPASGSKLIFTKGSNKTSENYHILKAYSLISSDKLLQKVLGRDKHGGGNRFSSDTNSKYIDLSALVDIMLEDNSTTPDDNTTKPVYTYYEKVNTLDNYEILRKAAIIIAGRIPTAAEIDAVDGANEATLRATLRNLMQGEGFDAFLHETADTHFLMSKLNPKLTYSTTDYPNIEAAQARYGSDAAAFSARNEIIELLKYIVNEDHSYKEILTADYMMVNKYLNMALETGIIFDESDDNLSVWKPARIGGNAFFNFYNHAGVLTSPSWLARFPTTDTNRNRHRTKMFFKQFLGLDLETLAQRAVDDTGVYHTPTLQNPNCTICHNTMDPVAGAFQNWGKSNRYRKQKNHTTALTSFYTGSSYPKDEQGNKYYQSGDTWFRDVLKPGFNGEEMNGGYKGDEASLQWLASHAVLDDRFAVGAVKFWYEGLFGIKPVESPFDSSDPDYEQKLSSFTEQNKIFLEIASKFRTDQGHGDHNVKDLLVELLMSPWFGAKNLEGGVLDNEIQYSDLGMARLLTPEQLQRKLISVTGRGWNEFNNFLTRYGLDYGGFDTEGLTERNSKLTPMMGLIIERMGYELSCQIVADEFSLPQGDRKLFTKVDILETENSNQNLIREQLVELHQRFLGQRETLYSAEINASYQLFVDIRADKDTPDSGLGNSCRYAFKSSTNNADDNYSGRSWTGVINYLLTDPYFIYE